MVQFLKIYISPEKIEILIVIYLRIAQNWQGKLEYEYKNVRKNVFIDRYKGADVVEDHKNFLKRLNKLKQYIVEFEEDCIMKPKVYFFNCAVKGNKQWLINIITYDKCTFFANHRIRKTWT